MRSAISRRTHRALYVKTKNFYWHVSGPHFRDYHLLLDEQRDQIFATIDAIAERVRKIGGTMLCSIGPSGKMQRIPDTDADYVTPLDMLAELREDNLPCAKPTNSAINRLLYAEVIRRFFAGVPRKPPREGKLLPSLRSYRRSVLGRVVHGCSPRRRRARRALSPSTQ
jgi:hypothetical protein